MEKTTKCRKLHNEMFNASRNIIKSYRMGWVVHVARRSQIYKKAGKKHRRKRATLGDVEVEGRVIRN
jgi:hypothetical protein